MLVPDRVYHYGSDGEMDHGWGCVYRAAQNVLHALGMRPVPGVADMMKSLDVSPGAQGMARWIEPLQVQQLLRLYAAQGRLRLPGVPLLVGLAPKPHRMLRTRPDDFNRVHADWHAFHADVVHHLRTTRVPVVVDDGVLGLCVAGFRGDGSNGQYMLLDPHQPSEPVRFESVATFYGRVPMLMAVMFLGH